MKGKNKKDGTFIMYKSLIHILAEGNDVIDLHYSKKKRRKTLLSIQKENMDG
jgi:hypothetical protein